MPRTRATEPSPSARVCARVIVLAGPSGSGKSRLSAHTGLPVLRLDDFYREAGDPGLPLIAEGPNAGLVDWDHPGSWSPEDAVAALEELTTTGRVEAPTYDISTSSRTGSHPVELGGAPYVVAEGIFAQDLVPLLARRGLLAAAFCLDQSPLVTFWRRLHRDLRERRKPPRVLVARGLALMREQRTFVRRAVALGCEAAPPDEVRRRIAALVSTPSGQPVSRPWAATVLEHAGRQPDRRTCGAAVLVVARMLDDEAWADAVLAEGVAAEALATHARVTGLTDATGRTQAPWWRAWGTPPWAVARELATHGPRRVVVPTLRRRDRLAARVRRAVEAGHSVVWYVGSRRLPRHVVLVVGVQEGTWRVFEPSTGRVLDVGEQDFVCGRARVAGWPRTWALVLPRVR